MMAAPMCIEYLLAVIYAIDINDEFAAKVIKEWPSPNCAAPAGREELKSRIEVIFQEFVGEDVTPGPDPRPGLGPGPELDSTTVAPSARRASGVSTPGPAKEHSASSSLTNQNIMIIIDDDDDEIENADTLVMLRELSVSGPALSCGPATSPTNEKSGRTSPTNSVIIIDDDDAHITPTVGRDCSPTTTNNNTVAFPSPESMRKQVAMKDAKTRSIKAKSARSKGKKKVVDNENDSKRDEMLVNPFSLGSTRKHRPKIDYNYVPKYEVYDRPDEEDDDFEYEERDDDKRLDQAFEKEFPVLDTPSQRQKTKK